MARDRERSRRDSAGVGPDPQLTGELTPMSKLGGFKIADGEPDIRGWAVRTLSGSEIGEVDDLLVDEHRGEVVMIDIDLKDADDHVQVPLRGVQLDRDRSWVIVDSGDVRTARERFAYREDDEARRTDVVADTRGDEVADEVVVERRPVIEEVVIRRRVIDSDTAADER